MLKQVIVNEYYCDKCGKKIDKRPELAGYKNEIHLCYDCYCNYYDTCSVCGTTLPKEDIYHSYCNDPYCEKCVSNLEDLYQDQIDAIEEFKNRRKN